MKASRKSALQMNALKALLFCLLSLSAAVGFAQSDSLAEKSQRAKEFMAQGKFAEAVPLYRELNRAVPNNPGLLLNLGMALHMAGDEHGAVVPLRAAVKLDRNLAPAWLFLGTAHLQLGQAVEAIADFKTVLDLEPNQREAIEMLADALFSLNRTTEAMERYQELTNLDPESSPAWYGLGRSYESLSVRAFDELRRAAPDSAYWFALAAEARLREQQFSSAFYLYRQALAGMATMRGLHGKIAEIYRETGHPEWAAAEEEKERTLPPVDCSKEQIDCEFEAGQYSQVLVSTQGSKTPESLYWRSRACNELALGAFTRLGMLPPSLEQHEFKASIYNERKKYSEAVLEWSEALKLVPANKQIQKQLAISLKFNKEYDKALRVFEELLRAQPHSAELNYLAGDTLAEVQHVDEAIPLLRRAVAYDPKLLAAQRALARAYLASGRAAEAIPHLLAALPTDEDGSLHYQLANAYQMTGKPELSKQTLVEYRKIQDSARIANEAAKRDAEITPP